MITSRRLWSLLGLLLVPLVVAGGFLWATFDLDSRLERVEAAVVNLDEPVRLDGQLVPLGRQLAGGLVEGPEDENFRWTLTDDEDAADGLASGRYAAVVTVPAEFSARATSFSKNEAAEAERATIEVQTSEVSGIADPVIGRAVTAAATRVLNTELTERYLDGIYLGFNQLNKQFGTLGDGAAKLADGSKDLSGGLRKTATGGSELADGLTRLDRGADQLATGAGDLSDGTGQLSRGLGQLSTGVSRTAEGTDDLADGASDLSDGTGRLSRGLGQLSGGVSRTADGADELAGGAADLTSGAKRLAGGADDLADGADDLAGGVGALRNGTREQPGGTRAYAAGVREFAGGVAQYSEGLRAEPTEAQIQQLCSDPRLQPSCADPASRQVLATGFGAGLQGAAEGLEDRGGQPGLLSSAERLAEGAAGIDSGVGQLQTGATTYAKGADRFATGVDGLAKGSGRLAGGADRLAVGLDQLATGARRSATGSRQLATGAGLLAGGADRLSDGLDQLATGAGKSAAGAKQLATGAGQLSTGATGLATGTGQSAEGAGQLADGLTRLSAGGAELAKGTRQFADGIAEGREKVPTYTRAERDRLGGVVSAPVAVPATDGASYSDIAITTLLVVLALWLGGLAAFLVLQPVTTRVLASMKPSWRLAFEALAPAAVIGAVQALVLSVVLQRLLDLSAGTMAALVPFTVLVAVAFAAVNQALVAALGGLGRFLSVAAAVVVGAGALTGAAPAALAAVAPYLPITPALQGVRALVSDGGSVGPAVGVLVGWLLLAVSVSVLAVARRRMLPADAVAPRVAPAR